ncbi:MAG: hypothetical protein JST93_08040 [Acidobacteria bacterium]|nr:hypothetical protein [Acidobacteriota bacterium]
MLVAVGGHSRNVGKTSVMCGIIAALREMDWVAVKITQHGHGICSLDGKPCDCAPENPEHPYVLDEQVVVDGTDSGRYLAAGAARAYWLRTAMGDLGHAMPVLRELMGAHENVILESNSVLGFLKPDVYVAVLDPETVDFKESARLFLERADALYWKRPLVGAVPWAGVPERWLKGKPGFAGFAELGAFVSAALHSGHGQRKSSDAAADSGADAGIRPRA